MSRGAQGRIDRLPGGPARTGQLPRRLKSLRPANDNPPPMARRLLLWGVVTVLTLGAGLTLALLA